MILIGSSNNLTGTVYSKKELELMVSFAKEKNRLILSDEIYEKLIYGDTKYVSVASLSEDAYKRTTVILWKVWFLNLKTE